MARFAIGVTVGLAAGLALALLMRPSEPAGGAESADRHVVTEPQGSGEQVGAYESAAEAIAQTAPAAPADRSAKSAISAGTAARDDIAASPAGGTADANPIRLPDSHRGFVERTQMQLPDAHAELEREGQDVEWAEVVERLLYEFLTTHPSGANIGVVSLVCRSTRCEIAGSVYGEAPQQTWRTVRTDLMAQPWFSTYLSRSIMESSADFTGELRFVAIISRAGAGIAPPVPQ